ncbi:MAG TPA: selenocysteine-specific translation elongation factor [Chthoniobacterales bacterium]|nr:selenocysteine-specific translation elongation factor [Chthoniobacterales bacterium]
MSDKHFILATAGHVDHGKSALIKALTGTDPDRLPEEKARGITIDLGFAHLLLSESLSTAQPLNPSTFSIGIVDVPGHEDFINNMIAGVGSIDLALLAVAANEGWMPQTEEHLQILSYLGVKRLVVALTKSDVATSDIVADQIREKLRGTPFADSRIIPTSIRTGVGLEDLKSALAQELATSPPPPDVGKARLFVDRAFKLHGIGTIVTGTLIGGLLRVGESVFVLPRNLSARIRSLQTHGRNVDLVLPGMRTAINLPDLEIGSDIKRGDVITSQSFEPTSTLDVFLTRSERFHRTAPIKSGTSVYVHHGTSRVLAKMVLAERASLAPGENAVAQLRSTTPLFAFVGDRLIIRNASGQQTIAGGPVITLEDCSSKQGRALLASRAVAPEDIALAVWTEIASGDLLQPSRLLERSRFSSREIAAALQRLAEHGEIFLTDNVAAKMLAWRGLRDRVAGFIDAAHKAHPEQRGLELNDLRAELKSISSTVFDALIHDLCRGDFVRAGSTISRASHRASLPAELKMAAEEVRTALAMKPFDPPRRKDLVKDREQQQALRFLIDHGEIVEISDEIVLLRASVDQMQTTISDFISTNGPATASQLREKLESSRRVIIPFLEYLDRTGVTQRVGDLRKLREQKPRAVAGS